MAGGYMLRPTCVSPRVASESAITSRDCWSSIETGGFAAGDSAAVPLAWGIQDAPPPTTSSTSPGESTMGLQN